MGVNSSNPMSRLMDDLAPVVLMQLPLPSREAPVHDHDGCKESRDTQSTVQPTIKIRDFYFYFLLSQKRKRVVKSLEGLSSKVVSGETKRMMLFDSVNNYCGGGC